MRHKLYVTPDVSIEDDIKPKLKRWSKGNVFFYEKSVESCEQVIQQLRNTSLNTPSFHQHITRTINISGTQLTIVGTMEKPSLLKRILG
jgi:hypothetical protein